MQYLDSQSDEAAYSSQHSGSMYTGILHKMHSQQESIEWADNGPLKAGRFLEATHFHSLSVFSPQFAAHFQSPNHTESTHDNYTLGSLIHHTRLSLRLQNSCISHMDICKFYEGQERVSKHNNHASWVTQPIWMILLDTICNSQQEQKPHGSE